MWGPIKYNVNSPNFVLPCKQSANMSTQVNSRIIIDTYAWNRFNPTRQVSLSSLGTKVATPINHEDEYDDYDDEDDEGTDDDDYEENIQRSSHAIAKNADETPALNLTKEQLLLCSATLKGYSLKNKKWRKQEQPISCRKTLKQLKSLSSLMPWKTLSGTLARSRA